MLNSVFHSKAEKELHDTIDRMNSIHDNYDTVTTLAPTGEPHVTLTNGGIKKDREPDWITANTAKVVCGQFLEKLIEYVNEKYKFTRIDGGTFKIYWRKRPEIKDSYKYGGKYKIYSRLLATWKEELTDGTDKV